MTDLKTSQSTVIVQKLRSIAKTSVNNAETPSFIPGWNQLWDKKISMKYRIVWCLALSAAISTCCYQSCERIIYFLQEPTSVNGFLSYETEGYLPALTLLTGQTPKLLKYIFDHMDWFNNQSMCWVVPTFAFDNATDMSEIWENSNSTTIINSIRFKRANKQLNSSLFGIDTIPMVPGTTAKIYHRIPKLYDSTYRLELRLRFQKFLNAPSLIFGMTPEKESENTFAATNFYLIAPFIFNEVSVSLQKYRFKRTKRNQCVSKMVMEKCQVECYMKEMKNFSCRYPFLPEKNNESYCRTTKKSCVDLQNVGVFRQTINPTYNCRCPNECDKTIIFTHRNYIDELHIEGNNPEMSAGYLEFFLNTNWIRTFVEEFSYDFISLLCDIGGNVGFFTGVSFIMAIDILVHASKKILYYPSNKTDILHRKVQQEVKYAIGSNNNKLSLTGFGVVFNKESSAKQKNVWICILLLFALICSFQIYNRISYHLMYPVRILIEMSEDRMVQFPSAVTCQDNSRILIAKDKQKKNLNLPVQCSDDVDILQLLDPPSRFEGDAKKLWEATTAIGDYQVKIVDIMKVPLLAINLGNFSKLPTVFGVCTKVTSEKVIYNPIDTNVWVVYAQGRMGCNCKYKTFLLLEDDRIDFKNFFLQPCDNNMIVQFVMQTFIRLNTPIKPCKSKEEFTKCEKDCLRKQFINANLTCSLPSMNLNLSHCTTSKTAKQVKDAFLKVYANQSSLAICDCHTQCEETIYLPTFQYDNSVQFPGINPKLTIYRFGTNLREILKEEFAMPLIKLVCDIGSNVGIFLGMSVLSLLELLQKVLPA